MAAWRIARAWQQYSSSNARATKLTAIVYCQAAVRRWLAREQYSRMQKQQHMLAAVEKAACAGNLEQLRAAAAAAEAEGTSLDELHPRGRLHGNSRHHMPNKCSNKT
jgi:hypothetical protein